MRFPVIFNVRPDPVSDHQGLITNSLVGFVTDRLRHFFGSDASIVVGDAVRPGGPSVVATLTTLNPLFDEILLARMIKRAADRKRSVLAEGAVGGTAPVSVVFTGVDEGSASYLVRHDGQDRYNSQLGLAKLKRVKIFRMLQRRMPDLAHRPLFSLLDFLGTPDGVVLVLSYGEEIAFDRYNACPACGDPEPTALRCNDGQPRIGFLTRHSAYYWACGTCGLVFLNPVPSEQDLAKLYDWYDKERLAPIADADFDTAGLAAASYARLFELTLDRCGPLVRDDARIVDLGGGSGAFVATARRRYPAWRIEVQDFDCEAVIPFLSKRGIEASSRDFTRLPLEQGRYDLITLFEVIEHLRVERLKAIWPMLYGALRPGGVLAFSTPDFASPYARLHDFWAAFTPHHLTVLSRRVLEPLWRSAGFETIDVTAESLLFRPEQGDFDYYRQHAGSLAERASAEVLRDVSLDHQAGTAFHAWRRRTGQGGEMLAILRRPAGT